MPFDDDSFDRVLSTFGHMFAPDHEQTAGEMKRVTRPDGRIVICCWTAEGAIGRMFAATLGATAPLAWGTEEHVRELLGDAEFERREVEWTDESSSATRTSCSRLRAAAQRAERWRARGEREASWASSRTRTWRPMARSASAASTCWL